MEDYYTIDDLFDDENEECWGESKYCDCLYHEGSIFERKLRKLYHELILSLFINAVLSAMLFAFMI